VQTGKKVPAGWNPGPPRRVGEPMPPLQNTTPELSRQTQTKIGQRLRRLLPDVVETMPVRLEFALARLEAVTAPPAPASHPGCMGRCLTHVITQASRRQAGRTVVVVAMAIESTQDENKNAP
jgi:hypothetical protein